MDKTEITKAIESHRKGECHNCPYEHLPRCFDILCENTVAFIKELTANVVPRSEVEKARKEGYESGKRDNLYGFSVEELAEKCELFATENERLRAENQGLRTEIMLNKERDNFSLGLLLQMRSDTVRKMQAEIKERCIEGGIYPAFVASTIEKIANELLNEEKCEKITKIPAKKCEIVKKTIDAVRSRGTRNAYSCIISGELRETYTISGKALDEIEKELLEGEK